MQIKKSKLPPRDMLSTNISILTTKEIIGIAGFIGLNIALFVLMVAFY
jgi:hypothetical protein